MSSVAQAGFEPAASFVLSEGGLPVAYRADFRDFRFCPEQESNLHTLGFKPSRLVSAEAVGLEPTSEFYPPPVFKTGSSSGRMTSKSFVSTTYCGGRSRTSGTAAKSGGAALIRSLLSPLSYEPFVPLSRFSQWGRKGSNPRLPD